MRGASRETYAAAADKLDELARAGQPAALVGVGDELLSVAGLLSHEPRLRRALADPSRSGKDRAGLLDGLIAASTSADTRTVLGVVASGRWSSSAELLDGVELLGVDALLASANRAGDISEVEDELFRFGQVVDGSPELAANLADTSVPVAVRASLVDALLTGKAKAVTVRLARLALTGFGGRTFQGALTRLVELAADQRHLQVAYVTVAKPLSDEDEQRIGTRLAQMYGRDVSIQVTVDPTVLGGARVLIGSDLYDGTTLRRLTDARHAVTGK